MSLGKVGLAELERTRGPEDHSVAVLLTNLSTACGAIQSTRSKVEMLERALHIKQSTVGPVHRSLAVTLVGLGTAYGELGECNRQRELLERALEIEEREYGPEHREVSVTLTNLGNAYGELGNYDQKRELLERALEIKLREFGPNHYRVAATLANLGNVHGTLGDPTKQRDLLLRTLAIEERHYGPDHLEVGITLISLGQAYATLGEHKLALSKSERALRNARASSPTASIIAAEMCWLMALVQWAAGEKACAEQIWKDAMVEAEAASGQVAARSKCSLFVANAVPAWFSVGRVDVVGWLKGVSEESR